MAVYMLSTDTQLMELLKLPLLLEHFQEHNQWDPDISFIGFMYMHYVSDDNTYGDQERDMQMPFKKLIHSFESQTGFIMPTPDFSIIPKTELVDQRQDVFTYSSGYSFYYLSSIWQPPRSC